MQVACHLITISQSFERICNFISALLGHAGNEFNLGTIQNSRNPPVSAKQTFKHIALFIFDLYEVRFSLVFTKSRTTF